VLAIPVLNINKAILGYLNKVTGVSNSHGSRRLSPFLRKIVVSILFSTKVAMASKHATRAKFVGKESKVPTARDI
jgi:hypothetical protein